MKAKQSTLKTLPILSMIIILATTMIFASCGEEKKVPADEIRQKISDYNQQIVDLNRKITDLERQLELLGETTQNRVRIPVEITTLELEPFDHYFMVNASVEAVRDAMISPEMSGQIREITVSKGQKVEKGQVLARLNTSVIENNISELKTSLRLAETVYGRQKRLWDQQIGSEMQYLEVKNNYESLQMRLKALESQLDMAIIRAPINGVIDDIFAKNGEIAMPGSRLMQIINLDQLYINTDVSESFLPSIQPKDSVILRFASFPDYEEKVPIFRLGNVINPENRTFRLQLRINNPDEQFKPNMVASVSIRSFSTDQALVVPSFMIKQDIQGFFVYVATEDAEGDQVAQKIYIERGLSGEGQTMVISGIEPGDRLITQGHNRVSNGTLINISEERTLAQNN
jgi:membrane fusion protein, multidrug efflux system